MVHVRLMSALASQYAESWLVKSLKASFTHELNQQALRVDRHLPRWQSSIVLRV